MLLLLSRFKMKRTAFNKSRMLVNSEFSWSFQLTLCSVRFG